METELHNLVFVWISVVTALKYCRYISELIHVGPRRLFFFLPVILLFLLLPLRLTTILLCSLPSIFVAWLYNFKVLILARGKGPLAPPPPLPPLSLLLFVVVAVLPIKISPSTGSTASKNGGSGGGGGCDILNFGPFLGFTKRVIRQCAYNRISPGN
ncbi:hypothetical protein NL676_007579 [Syzygium grande]|nr:hypothetical protein NL676_007579 [Syzygium grande]